MCGRYVIEWLPDELSERFQLRRLPAFLFENFNAAPTQELPVILQRAEGERELVTMRWGLIPRWAAASGKAAPAPFNARAESLLEKPMFRSLVGRTRCLVPANGYYEWKAAGGKKQPYFISVADTELLALAGLYNEFTSPAGETISSFTVITTRANEFASEFHHRMPVILRREDEAEWADPHQDDEHAVLRLLEPYPGAAMTAHPVSTAVNNVRNNDATLFKPIDLESAAPRPGPRIAGTDEQRSLW